MNEELMLVGDKVLIEPDNTNHKTDGGLFLPQGVREKEKVQYGIIVKIGPGYPVVDPSFINQDPWSETSSKDKYFPLQAKEGDHCIFLKDHGFEIQYKRKKYYVVSHSAVLMLIRNNSKIAGVTLD